MLMLQVSALVYNKMALLCVLYEFAWDASL